MDNRRSIYCCRGAVCGRCRVGRDAAGKTGGRSRCACSHPFGGGVTFKTGAESDNSCRSRTKNRCRLTLRRPEFVEGTSPSCTVQSYGFFRKRVLVDDSPGAKLGCHSTIQMNQLMLTFPSSNFLRQQPAVQKLSFPEETRLGAGSFCPTELNRWIARWENEGGAVALGRSADVTS